MSTLIRIWRNLAPGAAFEVCLRPHLERLWRLAVRLQGNPDDAEDLLQELLERAWNNRRQLLALDAPGPWLAKVLYRLHVDRWRRRGVLGDAATLESAELDPGQPLASDGERALLSAVATDELLAAVQRLPEQQRAVLLLYDGEGYTLEEIAGIVEVPVGTVKSRLHRARAAVRAAFAEGTEAAPVACTELEAAGGGR